MSSIRDRLARWNAQIDATGDIRAMSVLRILLGPIVLLHLEDTFRRAADGVIYSDGFYLPYASWYPEAGRSLYEPMLLAAGIAAIAMSAGLMTRLATSYSALFVGYNIFLSKTHFSHNRAFLLILLITVAIIPTGRYYSVDAWITRRFRGGPPEIRNETPLWPLWLVRFEVVAVYCASAVSKVIDQDWWGGRVLQLRAIAGYQQGIDGGAPTWLMDVLADGTFQWWFSKSAVLTEFVIVLGFLHRRTRLLAIWIAVVFHVSIEITARVQVFSWAALAALIIWVTPRARDRTLVLPRGHLLGRVVPILDWFGRFEIEPGDGDSPVLIDRPAADGSEVRRTGSDAIWTVLSRLPVTFWLAAPALLIVRSRLGRPAGDTSDQSAALSGSPA